MVTAVKKKASPVAKAQVVPAKAIASAAAKADVVKPPANKLAAKSVSKLVSKSVAKPATKAVKKAVAKAVVTSSVPTVKKPVVKATPVSKSVAKPASKAVKLVPVKPVVAAAPKEKHKKPKLIRDSFTMPEAEYAVLGEVKKACIAAGIEVKKSQLLRVGLVLLKTTSVTTLKTMIEALPALKAGRPKVEK